MQAVLFRHYGPPEGLELAEADVPSPKDDEVLIKVRAAAANPLDWHRMRGKPFLVRLSGGLFRPRNPRFGADVAGRVEAVGRNVTEFQVGDEVFGTAGDGSFAEYACVGATKLARKPANVSFEAAAAVPVAALTALQGLRDKGRIQTGQTVLINGASGGVGTFAVQIAKSYGAEVTGVCSTANLERVRSLGADRVIDYTQEDFTRNGRHYDLIYDAVGNRSLSAYRRALSPRGICVIAGFTALPRMLEHITLGPLLSRIGKKKIGFQGMATIAKKDLVVLKDLLEAGKVVPVMDRSYPLCETAEAIRYLEKGHARGKVVITVG